MSLSPSSVNNRTFVKPGRWRYVHTTGLCSVPAQDRFAPCQFDLQHLASNAQFTPPTRRNCRVSWRRRSELGLMRLCRIGSHSLNSKACESYDKFIKTYGRITAQCQLTTVRNPRSDWQWSYLPHRIRFELTAVGSVRSTQLSFRQLFSWRETFLRHRELYT